MPVLETGKCGEEMERATHEIYYLEKEADELLAETLATLYDGVTDISHLINAMRWGAIFQIHFLGNLSAQYPKSVLRGPNKVILAIPDRW